MTTELTPPPRQSVSPPARAARPPWVDADVLREWSGWVRRETEADEVPLQTASAPFTLEPTASVPQCSAPDVAAAVARARVAQRDWAGVAVGERARLVLAFHDLLLEAQEQVLDLIQWETGKARFHAWQEVGQVVALARHYGRRAEHYLKPARLRGMVPGATVVKEVRVPKGVVGIISPWNYPLYLGVGDVLPALLAGNAVVSKADAQTPLTLLWTRALMDRAGLPADVWQVVTGVGEVTGPALVDAVDYVAFTGSTATGREVARRAAGRLVGASLEPGGKNPLVVRRDADLAAAAHGAATAAFANTGQMCIHVERVYAHEDVYDEFRDALVRATEELRLGSAYDYSVDVGSLTSLDQLERVTAHVEDAVAQGARVLTGGQARPDLGPLFFEPTVLEGVTSAMRIFSEETFGPVVSLYPFASDADAVALSNEGTYGLSASVWSRDVGSAERLAVSLRAGAVNINDGAAAAAGSVEAGMGGMGESGLGRRHGAEGIRRFTDAQTVARQRLMPLGPPPGKPVEAFVHQTNRQLALMRRLRLR
ncbi:succinic semialdehyde dehydrogenase [Nocardioides campestrisoli]|uniref:succinic semialdehyde dehydrogenase n=1 Tax=Nocardioides campestrisoli TaxID=2736757 RepID=UPI0015E7BDAB|nr:succinic semialdehyde dehydrogenase [Nocardioides campestrisoli]